jgi:hypothetical protein
MASTSDEKVSNEQLQPERKDAGIKAESVPPNPDDPEAPSRQVSSTRQRISDIFTIICAGFALISDGYQNNLM